MNQLFSTTATAATWVSIAAAFAFASPAAAAEQKYNTYEITPFAGYMFGGEFTDPGELEDSSDDSDLDLNEATNYGVIFDIAADEWRHYEFLYSRQGTEVESADVGGAALDMDVQYLQIGGIVSHPDAERVIPFFGLTVGATQFSPDLTGLDDETALSFSAGGGMRIAITENIGVRFDARVFVTMLDSDGDIFCVSGAAGGACAIRAESDTFVQYAFALGVMIGF